MGDAVSASSIPLIEPFAPLAGIPGLVHGFVLRAPDLPLADAEKTEALQRLGPHHEAARIALGIEDWPLAIGEQVHGTLVGEITAQADLREEWPGTDGFVTGRAGVALGVHVADCGAVYLVDPVRRTVGLVHSGKKGTELGIVPGAIRLMNTALGADPADLVIVLGPCIRPPAYEVDFAGEILRQCREAGVPAGQIHDCGICTTSDAERYYSYRQERGRTGRHLALLGWRDA